MASSLFQAHLEATGCLQALKRLIELWQVHRVPSDWALENFRDDLQSASDSLDRLREHFPEAMRGLMAARSKLPQRSIITACERSDPFALRLAKNLTSAVVSFTEKAAPDGIDHENLGLCFEGVSASGADRAGIEYLQAELDAQLTDAIGVLKECAAPGGTADQETAGGKKQLDESAGQAINEKRPAYGRDHAFLDWYEASGQETSHSLANIRDKWNALSQEERAGICSCQPNRVGKGEPGRDLVKKAVQRARKERSENR